MSDYESQISRQPKPTRASGADQLRHPITAGWDGLFDPPDDFTLDVHSLPEQFKRPPAEEDSGGVADNAGAQKREPPGPKKPRSEGDSD